MSLSLTHHLNDAIIARYANTELFRYCYSPATPQLESPKPYFHPLRTLAGDVVTIHRPHDHLWHHGLAMTLTYVSGQNFWGGVSYVRDQGYKQLPNNGRQQHVAWELLAAAGTTATLRHRLHWLTQAHEPLLDERRMIAISDLDPEAGVYRLTFTTELTNTTPRELLLGSPTTEGRANAGYGSLFWRGPRDFAVGGTLLMSDDRALAKGDPDEKLMGQRSPWLAYIGSHDESARKSTLLFIDSPANPRYPTQWFCRASNASASFAFMFDQYYPLPPAETLRLTYHLAIATGAWTRAQIEAYAATVS